MGVVARLIKGLIVVTQGIVHRNFLDRVDIVVGIGDAEVRGVGLRDIGSRVINPTRGIKCYRVGFVDVSKTQCDLPSFAVRLNGIQFKIVVVVQLLGNQVGAKVVVIPVQHTDVCSR